jgi:hypothetical protein
MAVAVKQPRTEETMKKAAFGTSRHTPVTGVAKLVCRGRIAGSSQVGSVESGRMNALPDFLPPSDLRVPHGMFFRHISLSKSFGGFLKWRSMPKYVDEPLRWR